ncbi:hypothetical protein L1049_006299 [Liquidambar formosana]|uniref:Uncharacterized protein n=1 Tax=Liquidambar formosana TaxID=63359 RepID=A0AAP0RH45_LIQFO
MVYFFPHHEEVEMTIKQGEQLQNVSQQRKLKISDEPMENICEGAWQNLQQSDMQWELRKKHWHAAKSKRRAQRGQCIEELEQFQTGCWQGRRKEDDRACPSEKRHLDEGQINEENTPGGGIDQLLILANSAELLLESEDNFHSANRNNQNSEGWHTTPIDPHIEDKFSNATPTDQKPLGEQLDGMQAVVHMETREGFHGPRRATRLNHIRYQARSKNHSLVQEEIGEYTHGHLQGKTIRLSQLRHQARSKNLVPEGIKEHKHGHLDSQTSEVLPYVAAQRWCEQIENTSKHLSTAGPVEQANGRAEPTRHLAQVNCDTGELKEQQRIARQLRVLRTNKQRGKLSRQNVGASLHKEMHASMKTQIGQTGVNNAEGLPKSSMMLKDQNFIAFSQQLLRTSEQKMQLGEEHPSAAQIQGHPLANQPRGQIHEAYHQQRVRNMLGVQDWGMKYYFTVFPNQVYQQGEAEQLWLLQMADMQQKEFCRMAARQRRAQRIEAKRASKNLHKKLKNHVLNKENLSDGGVPHLHAVRMSELDNTPLKVDRHILQPVNSPCHKVSVEAENKMMCAKGGIRLSQLRREARLGNAHLVGQSHAGTMDRGQEDKHNAVVVRCCTADNG